MALIQVEYPMNNGRNWVSFSGTQSQSNSSLLVMEGKNGGNSCGMLWPALLKQAVKIDTDAGQTAIMYLLMSITKEPSALTLPSGLTLNLSKRKLWTSPPSRTFLENDNSGLFKTIMNGK